MTKNFKKRILTSFILFLFLFFAFMNNFILGYLLIIISIFSIIEFANMSKIFLKNNKILQLIINLIFFLYVFYFCTLLLTFSFSLSIKVLIFLILLTCVASDIGGFIFGKIFKGPKLTKISPKKTIAGAVGSLIFSSGFAFILIFFLTKNYDLYIVIVGFITSLGCQIGDLFFSFLKRKSSLKDTGNFLPGHGGILDRIDGMLIGIPVGFSSLLIAY
tara:strand:- start:900 stop:1550 length:651 start_codon:yes stop_codon:yes gene_type:complete